MSLYHDIVTLELNGQDEQDYEVRAHVDIEMTGRGATAFIDGTPEVKVRGHWTALDDIDMTSDYRERVLDQISEAALEDDTDQCVDEDRDDRDDELYEAAS